MIKLDHQINVIVSYRGENPDSLEIGTPGKGGVVKIYGDYSDPDAFRAKIEAATSLRIYAAELLLKGGR